MAFGKAQMMEGWAFVTGMWNLRPAGQRARESGGILLGWQSNGRSGELFSGQVAGDGIARWQVDPRRGGVVAEARDAVWAAGLEDTTFGQVC